MTRYLSDYQLIKLALAERLSLSTNFLHYVLGLALVCAAVLWSRRGGSLLPFCVALAVAYVLGVGMELIDLRDDLMGHAVWNWHHSLEDLGRTVAFPTFALCVAVIWNRTDVHQTRRQEKAPVWSSFRNIPKSSAVK